MCQNVNGGVSLHKLSNKEMPSLLINTVIYNVSENSEILNFIKQLTSEHFFIADVDIWLCEKLKTLSKRWVTEDMTAIEAVALDTEICKLKADMKIFTDYYPGALVRVVQ